MGPGSATQRCTLHRVRDTSLRDAELIPPYCKQRFYFFVSTRVVTLIAGIL